MAEVLPIRRKTLSNQSTNELYSIKCLIERDPDALKLAIS